MEHQERGINRKLLDLMQKTGYEIVQHNGQRKFGPPPDWSAPPPPKGCEVFIGKLPREVYEDELVPLFSQVGKIYEMRMMMDFSGSNRGYAFVTYTTQADAGTAIRDLNGYEIRPGRNIGVVKSVDNCRLFVGNIPPSKTQQDIFDELSKLVHGIVDIILYKNRFDRNANRRFVIVEFVSHRAAAMARRTLIPGCVKLWDQVVTVDWAEPEPYGDEKHMKHVKVLYARNFELKTSPRTIKKLFETAINNKIERVKKIYDYAFIHFYERQHAELAMAKLQNVDVDGSNIEIRWAKPVDRDLYKIQKLNRGNAKFNNSFDLNQTLLLYKQHLEKKDYEKCFKDEGIGSSACVGDLCCSPIESKPPLYQINMNNDYPLAPAELASVCRRFSWIPPKYDFKKCVDLNGAEWWMCNVELPAVGFPLFNIRKSVGPFTTRLCFSYQQAHVEGAEIILHVLKMLKFDLMQQTMAQPVYTQLVSSVPNCVNLPYDCNIYQHTPLSMPPLPTVWRTI